MTLLHAHGVIHWLAADPLTTVYTVAGLSFQPKALRFRWVGNVQSASDIATETGDMTRGVGFANATTQLCCATYSGDGSASADCGAVVADDCVVGSPNATRDRELAMNAINSDGFSVIVNDVTPSNMTILWDVWGGDDITVSEVGHITEPAATGDVDYTVAGFVAAATDQIVMFAGCQSTAAINTSTSTVDSGFCEGFATGPSGESVVVMGNSDDGNAAMLTGGFAKSGACLAMMQTASGTVVNALASLTQFDTNNFRLNWTNRATTGRRSIFLAIKGGKWKVGSYSINGNSASATATVSGLNFTPNGLVLIGAMRIESSGTTATAEDRMGYGSGKSISDRQSTGNLDENATGSSVAEQNLILDYDSVLVFPSTSGTLQSAYDINAMNSDGFQIIVDTAGGVASEWQGYLTFGNTIKPIRQYSNGAFESTKFIEVSGGHAMRMYSNAAVQVQQMVEQVGGSVALEFAHGTIEWLAADAVSTTYTVSGLSFQPKFIQFEWCGLQSTTDATSETVTERRGIGFAANTAGRRCIGTRNTIGSTSSDCGNVVRNDGVAATHSGAGSTDGLLDLNAINSDGFELIVDVQVPANITIFWKAWGGDAITNVTVGDFTEPAATGDQNYTATGFVASATDQIVMVGFSQMIGAINASSPNIDTGLSIGYGDGTNAIIMMGNADEASGTMDTDGAAQSGQILAMCANGGGSGLDSLGNLTAFDTDLFRVNWSATTNTARKGIYAAIKGGNWKVGEYTINGNSASATAAINGLSFTPKGVVIMGRMATESANVTGINDRMASGCGTSVSDRHAWGILDEDGTANVEINTVLDYDSVLVFPSTSGTLQASYDINAMNADGFEIIVDTAGGVASEWQGYVTFGDVGGGSSQVRLYSNGTYTCPQFIEA